MAQPFRSAGDHSSNMGCPRLITAIGRNSIQIVFAPQRMYRAQTKSLALLRQKFPRTPVVFYMSGCLGGYTPGGGKYSTRRFTINLQQMSSMRSAEACWRGARCWVCHLEYSIYL